MLTRIFFLTVALTLCLGPMEKQRKHSLKISDLSEMKEIKVSHSLKAIPRHSTGS